MQVEVKVNQDAVKLMVIHLPANHALSSHAEENCALLELSQDGGLCVFEAFNPAMQGAMHMTERLEIARNVAEQLLAAETAIDAALACAAGLVGTMPVARQQARLSAAVGQPAIEHVVASISMLSEARRFMVEAHKELADCRFQARIPPTNFGGFIDKTPPQAARLNVVEKAAVA